MNTIRARVWATGLKGRVARALIQLVAFAAGGLSAWILSDDALSLVGDDKTLVGLAVVLQPVFSQLIGNYAGKIEDWLKTKDAP